MALQPDGSIELGQRKINKKFLKTDYPRGRAIEVLRRFYFGLWAKNRNFIFTPHPEL